MIGKKKLQMMHQKLGRNLGDRHNDHIFGNRSFLFAGDFQQFPPIGDPSLVSKQSTDSTSVRKLLAIEQFLTIISREPCLCKRNSLL